MYTKKRIASLAGELFMKHGVKTVSMDEIASRLGMSKRTIYQQFTDKEELLVFFLENLEQEQLALLDELSQKEPTIIDVFWRIVIMHKDIDKTYNVRFHEDIEKYYPHANAVMKEQQERGTEHLKDMLKYGMRQGVVRKDLNLQATAFLLQETNSIYSRAFSMISRPFTIWELFFTMMVNFIRGISTTKGIEIIDNYIQQENRSLEPSFNSTQK